MNKILLGTLFTLLACGVTVASAAGRTIEAVTASLRSAVPAAPAADVIDPDVIRACLKGMKDSAFFTDALIQIEGEKDTAIRNRKRGELYRKAKQVTDLQADLEWLNVKAIRMAFDDMKKLPAFDAARYQPLMDELERLSGQGFDGIYRGDEQALAAAGKALAHKRTILLANPLLDVDKVVAARFRIGDYARRVMTPRLGTQANNWSNQQSAYRTGLQADIVELSDLRGNVRIRSVFRPDSSASIADLKLHWDGDRVMFTSLMPDKRWNVFEIHLDGTGFKPLIETSEPELEFYDGTWLPDGRIIANCNIGYQGVPCVSGSDPVGNMVLYNPSDKSMRRLTFDQDANWNPVVMHNGRVMYVRWEYTDLTHYYSRIVMHTNPDGTDNRALFGSGSMFPNSTFDVQPLPGYSAAFAGIISGHHGVARSGRLMLFDPAKARKGAEGIIQEIPYRDRKVEPLVKDELVNDVWPQFIKPMPINDTYLLVSAKLSPQDLWGIYLVDIFDNVTCLMKQEGEGFISPLLVRKSRTPPVVPDRVKLNEKEATVFIQDLYEGEGLRGVPRGTIKELRIHAYEYAYLHTPSDHVAMGIQSGWDIKRLLGTVPVEEDGSAIFKIPANTPVSIQPLDEEGAAVQWMRSWFTGMPGEIVSCVGCHEDQNQIPVPRRVMASRRKPRELTVPPGGVRSFTYDLEVQPILDRACIACHDGNKTFDLRGGNKDDRGFSASYLNLHAYTHRQGPEADMVVLQPYEYHPNTSELTRLLKVGHHQVQLTGEEWRKLYNWIDYNVPDKGYFQANPYAGFPYQGYDQMARRIELTDKYGCGAGVDWKKELADYAAFLKKKGQQKPEMPAPEEPLQTPRPKATGWPFDTGTIPAMLAKEPETRKEITLAPGITITFVRIPSGRFVMGHQNGVDNHKPAFEMTIEHPFWMAETEVTNAQYNTFVPEHDSRYVDQFWKDHTRPGYDANRPHQPVIRISYEDAMHYCARLSEKTGLKITLPTEAQWEWACRAGSDKDFWFGDLQTDFSAFENLADAQLSKMAVSGIDPQPMSPDNSWFPYYDFLPKEETVDDGSMIQVDSKTYQANPFGLYSMHGNIAEWTRSDYHPYPYAAKEPVQPDETPSRDTRHAGPHKGEPGLEKQTSTHPAATSGTVKEHPGARYKVARGGSWVDRPKYATAYSRKAYHPWQRVHNVGFRLIIED
jgi:formylglycine-generating enzyme required for sulfatase activity